MFRSLFALVLFVAIGFSAACTTSAAPSPKMALLENFQDDNVAYQIYTINDDRTTIYYRARICKGCRPNYRIGLSGMTNAEINSTPGLTELFSKVLVERTEGESFTSAEFNKAITAARTAIEDARKRAAVEKQSGS